MTRHKCLQAWKKAIIGFCTCLTMDRVYDEIPNGVVWGSWRLLLLRWGPTRLTSSSLGSLQETTRCITAIFDDDGHFLPTCFSWWSAPGLSASSSAKTELIRQQPAAKPRVACVPRDPSIWKANVKRERSAPWRSRKILDSRLPTERTSVSQSVEWDTYRAGMAKTTSTRQVILTCKQKLTWFRSPFCLM